MQERHRISVIPRHSLPSPSLPAILGALGWLGAGPLAATLLVGRTSLLPSLRWLATATATWLVLAMIASLGTGRRDARAVAPRLMRGAATLAATASTAPLLPVLYLHDPSYHLTVSGSSAPATFLVAYTVFLAIGGAAVSRLVSSPPVQPQPSPNEPTPAFSPTLSPVLWAALATIGAATVANRAIFEPLSSAGGPSPGVAFSLVVNLGSLALASWLAARSAGVGALGATTLYVTWLWFAPLQGALQRGLPGPLLALGAAGLYALRARRSPIGYAPVALLAVALAGFGALGPPFWAVADVGNASVQALFSRLYTGPGALIPATLERPLAAQPVVAAQALTAGTLLTAALVVVWYVRGARPLPGNQSLAAMCFLLDALLALAPTTRSSLTPLAVLSLVPLLDASLWRIVQPRRRAAVASLTIAGYALAGTSTAMLLRAAAEWLDLWPALATLPALGLVLLALGQALCLDATASLTPPALQPVLGETPPPAPRSPRRADGTDLAR